MTRTHKQWKWVISRWGIQTQGAQIPKTEKWALRALLKIISTTQLSARGRGSHFSMNNTYVTVTKNSWFQTGDTDEHSTRSDPEIYSTPACTLYVAMATEMLLWAPWAEKHSSDSPPAGLRCRWEPLWTSFLGHDRQAATSHTQLVTRSTDQSKIINMINEPF